MRGLLLALALFAAAQAKGADARVSGLVAALGDSSNVQARNSAYLALLREKPPAALPLLAESLPRFDLQGQEYALTLLSVYPLEDSRPLLRKLLLERAPLLELGAAAMLWRAGERDGAEHLAKACQRKDTPLEVRRAMLRRLYLVDDARLSAALRAWIAPETDTLLLEDVFYHLLNVKDPELRAKAGELEQAPGLPAGSRAACAALLLAQGEDARGALLAGQLDADEGATLARLQRFLVLAPRLPDELVAAVARVAEKSATPALAQAAINVLAQHAGPKEIPTLERLLDNPNLYVAKSALEALQKRGVSIAHDLLLRMLASKENLRALSAADALRREDDLSGFERVLEVLHSGGAEKAEAVRVLAKFRRQASLGPLVDALEDPDATVRSEAEQGLIALLPSLFPYRRFDLATTGYQAGAAPEQRAAGVKKLRAWCAANGKL
jgi:HEAT repeat protein